MRKRKIRFLFIVQGEGRGHMTQSLAMQELLLKAGHEIVGVMIGKSPQREIPSFYRENVKAPLRFFDSPNFVLDNEKKGIKVWSSIHYNLLKNKSFFKSISLIDKMVQEYAPDVIVNFYELLCGLYFFKYKPLIKHITLSHHYLHQHPEFPRPNGNIMNKCLMKLNNNLTSIYADKILALSFKEMSDFSDEKTFVVPPLLRDAVKSVKAHTGEFLLIYILNEGYSKEIIEWHKQNSQVLLYCFWDKKEAAPITQIHENLSFFKLDDKIFLELFGSCKAYISSAGFESISEAIYLGKPVMVVPTAGHYEQLCNSLDAIKVGAGISNPDFNIQKLLDYLPRHKSIQEKFISWVDTADEVYLRHLEEW